MAEGQTSLKVNSVLWVPLSVVTEWAKNDEAA